MKISLILILISIFFLSGCDNHNNFEIPQTDFISPSIEGEIVDISSVISLYNQNEEPYIFQQEDIFLEGYVISSDESGNFFKQLILQDNPNNPNAGIAIEVDLNSTYTRYPIGNKVYIKLYGLAIGLDNGVFKIGRSDRNNISRIAASQLDSVLIRTAEIAEIIPKPINITQFSDEFENLFIELADVQFSKYEIQENNPKTFASEGLDDFDGERRLESCAVNASTVLSTSTFADFKSLRLPTGRGLLRGILTRDFFDEFYTIYLNTPNDILFDSSNRCDFEPISADSLNCGISPDHNNILFYEDFNDYVNLQAMEAAGWINSVISDGDTRFTLGSFDGNKYAQISGFNSEEYIIDSWLVSPEIDIDEGINTALQFNIQSSYSTGKHLSVLITENFNGNILETNWFVLKDISYPVGPSSGFGNMATTLPVNISCLGASKIRIAFRYQGSDPIATTRYHLDNITLIQQSD